ncbi:MAG TPA: two-component system response regulator [Pseudohongiella sp.]|nr:two-component system response regulator [Pseudohongiella sp.]MAY56028.1 two-component system response regulator [Gammaproteobacteria bacterium]HBX37860.1 two-component system response regulator [Pseudohongiella sp.]|tara:strand:+ start:8301 stop:9323 length:1023 start_codon:yes stop_codon:yes gene_type:complete
MTISADRPTLLLVDDEPVNLQVLRQVLQQDYRLLFARDGRKALELAESEQPELILLDVMMPGLTGFDTCRQLKANSRTHRIPVIFVTALNDEADETQGFDCGAVDYITKPISAAIVRARVKTHLSLVHTNELRETRLQIVQRLGLAAEYKDNETGLHVIRMSHFSRVLARAAGFSEAAQEELLHAAPMHDIGKIGIPDAILAKPGKLDAAEWDVMKQHPVIGAHIIGEQSTGLLHTARQIALYHHEKWDGSGYPHGLKGEEIPVEARIVAIADVFDALVSARPYKPAWPVEKAIALIQEEAGRHFDPELVELFLQQLPELLEIKERWAEPETPEPAAASM